MRLGIVIARRYKELEECFQHGGFLVSRFRDFWCAVASWTLWPMIRGFLLALLIFIVLAVISLIISGIAVVLR